MISFWTGVLVYIAHVTIVNIYIHYVNKSTNICFFTYALASVGLFYCSD